MHAQDTSELFFEHVRVPAANLLGAEGGGFVALMQNLPRERVTIGVFALAVAEKAFEDTLAYCKQRTAFGQPVGSFQHSRFLLAELATELAVARAFTDKAIVAACSTSAVPDVSRGIALVSCPNHSSRASRGALYQRVDCCMYQPLHYVRAGECVPPDPDVAPAMPNAPGAAVT